MPWRNGGWRGVSLIAITYVYFLIFAQFAFLKRLAELDIAGDHLKAVMAAMAAGGILLSLLAPRVMRFPAPAIRLSAAFVICGVAALLTWLPLPLTASIAVSALIGIGLGLLTVTLVTYLPLWLGHGSHLLKIGLGTGLGYFACNVPALFAAAPRTQAVVAAILCVLGTTCVAHTDAGDEPAAPRDSVSFMRVVISFTALVWLDSAAFFIIQNTPALKAGTWEGTVHLWSNGALHLAAALASAMLLRGGIARPLILAFLALACACLLLLNPSGTVAASAFYPIGVSLYSVALVAYPSLLTRAHSPAERGKQAGWIYAIAGWGGSAMGIGMGQNLGHVPPIFVLAAGTAILGPFIAGFLRRRGLESAVTVSALVFAFVIHRAIGKPAAALSSEERGRAVYISEGCISCHSQYVRPGTADVLMWGPVESLDDLRRQRPPLIGNRRQGPDLANVGNRRSPLWLKAHFFDPSELSPGSFMPSYVHLFRDGRGGDLVAYLAGLNNGSGGRSAFQMSWVPSESGTPAAGEAIFTRHCATCHAPDGRTRSAWQSSFRRLPPDLRAVALPEGLARIVKFGIPGTDMPGHEYLSDREIASVVLWLRQNITSSRRHQ